MRIATLLLLGAVQASAACAAAPRAERARATVVYLVRHAEKADTTRDPALSAAGEARAQALSAALQDAGVQAVVTTQLRRTALTAAPLARSRALTPEVVETSAQAHPEAVARLVRERHAGKTVLVVGHSNTVPAIVGALGGPRLPDLCDAEYSRLFVLVLDGDAPARLARTHYGAADPPGAGECAAAMRAR